MNIEQLVLGCIVKKSPESGYKSSYRIVVKKIVGNWVFADWTELESGAVYENHQCNLRHFERDEFVLEANLKDKKLEDYF
jgi:hypothetical protein